MNKLKIILSLFVISFFVFLAFGSVDDNSSNSSSETSLPSGGPDVCDCMRNAARVGTYAFDQSLQSRCENYSNRLSESQKRQRVSQAIDRGCL